MRASRSPGLSGDRRQRSTALYAKPPLCSAKDFREALALAALAPIAWIVPDRLWRPLCYPFGLLIASLFPKRTRATALRIAEAQGGRRFAAYGPEVRLRAGKVEQHLQVLREHRPGGWNPRVRLLGRERIDMALEAGRGAILWICPQLFAGLVTKMALHDAGYPVSHLSLFSHGFSQTRFGIRVLNPLQIRVDERYLHERIVLRGDGSLGYTRKLERLLRRNELLSITLLPRAHARLALPFLGRKVQLPTGPASLSLLTGAALLPVFALRRGAREFETIVEPALEVAPGVSSAAAVESLLAQQARRMETRALEDPGSWMWNLWDNA
jgi:lauroyl/myristoyl acyltransferase